MQNLRFLGYTVYGLEGVIPCTLPDKYQCLRKTRRQELFYPDMGAACSSEESAPIYQASWCHILYDCDLNKKQFSITITCLGLIQISFQLTKLDLKVLKKCNVKICCMKQTYIFLAPTYSIHLQNINMAHEGITC